MPLVNGIAAFRDAMSECSDEYALIGGGACSVLFGEVGEEFRLTKDLDIVILTDKGGGSGFARRLWRFVLDGGYRPWKRADEKCVYYRFNLPEDSPHVTTFPEQIELFARHPDFQLEDEESEITPLPFEEGVSSLSAIILDDGYYDFIRRGVSKVGGIPLLDALHIIPLKMRAHVDLNHRHDEGQHVNEKDLTKHRKDVAALSRLLTPNDTLPLPGQIQIDAKAFSEVFERYIDHLTNHKQKRRLLDDLQTLRRVYLA